MFSLSRNLILLLALGGGTPVFGGGDVTLRTSHPQYPGEGAFQTPEDCVEFATRGAVEPQDKAIAMYLWFLTHQWHLMSPMEWYVPGRTPDSADPGDYETVVFDANRGRFSYGYGLCGTVHAWNEVYWRALGLPARRREFPQHVNSEIFYDDCWHAFDTDMAGLLFRPDGQVAGYDDIQRNPELAESTNAPVPHYPFSWPNDFNTMKAGWKEVAERASWYRLYNGGYAAHPGIVSLRSGETFTRWFDRDHFGGLSKRRFWQNQHGGPRRTWTFFNNGQPHHDQEKSNSRSEATYCNGEFNYAPDLSSTSCREGMLNASDNIGYRPQKPELYSANGQLAFATFRHFSPYVICGDPVDDANPMSGTATDGVVMTGQIDGVVRCMVSADEGQSWTVVRLLEDDQPESNAPTHDFRVDLTELLKGRYGWQVRFEWQEGSGISQLQFNTTTQVSQAMYPRLTSNGCDVDYRSAQRAVVAVLPNFALPESEIARIEVPDLRSENLSYKPRSVSNRYAYHANDDNPCSAVFKVEAPGELAEVRAAVRYKVPVPPTTGCDIRFAVSTDSGTTWSDFATADIPMDNEFSSGWLYGNVDVSNAHVNSALVKVSMHTPGRPAAMIDSQFYGIYEVPPAGPVSVEFGWMEGDLLKTHETLLARKVVSTKIRVPTGAAISDSFVRITAED